MKESTDSGISDAIVLLMFVLLGVTFCGNPDLYDSWMLDIEVAKCNEIIGKEEQDD